MTTSTAALATVSWSTVEAIRIPERVVDLNQVVALTGHAVVEGVGESR